MNLGHFTIIVIAFLLSILVFYFYLNTTLDLKNYYSNDSLIKSYKPIDHEK